MSAKKETFGKTLGVVVGVCLVCSIVVSAAAVGLRAKQQENAKLDIQTNILEAAGLLPDNPKDIIATYTSKIEERYVDLKTGQFVEKEAGYNQRVASKDPAQSSKPENDIAKILRRPDVANVYLVKNDSGVVETIVIPINGAGLWNMMWAFMAVEADGNTTKNVVYYEQGETPGLGAEVLNPKWKAQWHGKKLYDDQGDVAIKVVKGGAKAGDVHGIDGLSGATLTGNGIQNTLSYWLSDEGFKPFLTQKPWKS